jgi:hypothetical protein
LLFKDPLTAEGLEFLTLKLGILILLAGSDVAGLLDCTVSYSNCRHQLWEIVSEMGKESQKEAGEPVSEGAYYRLTDERICDAAVRFPNMEHEYLENRLMGIVWLYKSGLAHNKWGARTSAESSKSRLTPTPGNSEATKHLLRPALTLLFVLPVLYSAVIGAEFLVLSSSVASDAIILLPRAERLIAPFQRLLGLTVTDNPVAPWSSATARHVLTGDQPHHLQPHGP